MVSTGEVIESILALEEEAARIRAQAREDAERIGRESVRTENADREKIDRQLTDRRTAINAEASSSLSVELDKVRTEYEKEIAVVRSLSDEKKQQAVQRMIGLLKGNA